jgi:hypothetical protein
MKLRKFNFGGLFGGLVCAAASAAILYMLSNGDFPTKGIKLVALAGFGGAALGNWIWRLAEPKTADDVLWDKPLNRAERQE